MMALGRYNDNQFNKSTLKYTFVNGSYIEFFSVDQPDKYEVQDVMFYMLTNVIM
jgi:hypothetical protein